jgi:hypothetical protein
MHMRGVLSRTMYDIKKKNSKRIYLSIIYHVNIRTKTEKVFTKGFA